MAETIVPEGSDNWVTMDFKDRAGDPETPATITWKVGDAIDGTTLATGTATSSSQVVVGISSTINIIRHGRLFERRTLHVYATFSTGEHRDEKSWLVRNLGFTKST